MIQARELQLGPGTTVTDLFKLMDIPFKITRKAKVKLERVAVDDPQPYTNNYYDNRFTLRLEWEVEKGDPAV
jgi:hypothetical protein